MLQWQAKNPDGYYAAIDLQPRTFDTRALLIGASYYNAPIIPSKLMVRNYNNNGSVTARKPSGDIHQIPSGGGLVIDIEGVDYIDFTNYGGGFPSVYFYDKAASAGIESGGYAQQESVNDYLYHFDTANAALNSGRQDAGELFLVNGAATESGYGGAKFGGRGLRLDPLTSTSLFLRDKSFFNSAEFTLDFWYVEDGAIQALADFASLARAADALSIQIRCANNILEAQFGAAATIITGINISSAVHKHFALTSDGVYYRLFFNGLLCAQADVVPGTVYDELRIGRYFNQSMRGIYDEVRFIRRCEWRADFTPPTEPYI